MARLAREGQGTYAVRSVATRVTHDVPSKDRTGELQALYRFVRDTVRYRFDPLGLEWVQSPERTLIERAGDCDDMATLLAALVGSLGHRWRFVTYGPAPGVMRHVAVEAHDGKMWVSLDPVLEPKPPTTEPRGGVGLYGMRAPARAHHIWSDGGTMLSGPTTARDRELWQWVPYYPQVPPAGGAQPAMPGAWTKPDDRYRSPDAPGYIAGKPIVITAYPGVLQEGLGYHEGLGFGFLKKIGKAIGKVASGAVKVVGTVAKGVTSVVKAVPGLNVVASAIPIVGTALSVLDTAGKVLGPGAKKPAPAPPPKALPAPKPVVKAAPKTAPKPVVKAAPKPALKPVVKPAPKPVVVKPIAAPAAAPAANVATRSDIEALRQEMRAAAGYATKADIDRLASLFFNPYAPPPGGSPGSAVRFPQGARQAFDPKTKQYQVFAPPRGVSGLGFSLRPTISFALSGLGAAAPALDKLAKAALDEINAFIKKHKKPPAIALMHVKAFQKAALLEKDGLYGPKTREKMAAALKMPVAKMPAIAPAMAKPAPKPAAPKPAAPKPAPAVVAKPAAVVVPLPKVAPPPAPVVMKPKPPPPTLAQLAQAAVDSVARHAKTHKGAAPAVPLSAVRAFQVGAKLKNDGLWGPKTRDAAAKALGKSPAKMPLIAPALAKTKPATIPAAVASGQAAQAQQQQLQVIATTPSNPGLPPLSPPYVPTPFQQPPPGNVLPVVPGPVPPLPKSATEYSVPPIEVVGKRMKPRRPKRPIPRSSSATGSSAGKVILAGSAIGALYLLSRRRRGRGLSLPTLGR